MFLHIAELLAEAAMSRRSRGHQQTWTRSKDRPCPFLWHWRSTPLHSWEDLPERLASLNCIWTGSRNYGAVFDALQIITEADIPCLWVTKCVRRSETRPVGRSESDPLEGGSFYALHIRNIRSSAVGMWESRVLCEISKRLWKSFCDFHSRDISIAASICVSHFLLGRRERGC
jgi:hypothetical protein